MQQAIQKKLNYRLLGLVTIAALLPILALRWDYSFLVEYEDNLYRYNHFAVLAFILLRLVINFSASALLWASCGNMPRKTREIFVSAILFSVGIIDYAGILWNIHLYSVISPIILITGLLVSEFIPHYSKRPWLISNNILLEAAVISIGIIMFEIKTAYLSILQDNIVGMNAIGYYIIIVSILVIFLHIKMKSYWAADSFMNIGMIFLLISGIAMQIINDNDMFVQMYYTVCCGFIFKMILNLAAKNSLVNPERRKTLFTRMLKRYNKLAQNVEQHQRILRERLQHASMEKNYRLMREMFNQINEVTISQKRKEDIYDQIIEIAAKIFDANYVFLSLAENAQTPLKTVSQKSPFKSEDLLWKINITKKIFTERTVFLTDDIYKSGQLVADEAVYKSLKSMTGVPLVFNNEVIGVIEICSRYSNKFSSKDASLLMVFSQYASTVIENAKICLNRMQKDNEIKLIHEIMMISFTHTNSFDILHRAAQALCRNTKISSLAAFLVQGSYDVIQHQEVFIQDVSTAEFQGIKKLITENLPYYFKESVNISKTSSEFLLSKMLVNLGKVEGKFVYFLLLYSRNTLQGLIVFILPRIDFEYFGVSAETLETIICQISISLERVFLYESVKEVGFTDSLTGLANRRFFDFSLSREINRARRYNKLLSLLILDIDYFKKVNDTFGHQSGDLILKQMGQLLKSQFRKIDITARYGGEEFAIILPETDSETAFMLTERLRQAVEQTQFSSDKGYISLTVSIGLASLRQNKATDYATGSVEDMELILAADQALYRAKQLGRNRTQVG